MVNKADYLQPIKHASCELGLQESSDFYAFKLDDNDGIAKVIGFHAGMVNKVDYFLAEDINVQLIELSDLEESARSCQQYITDNLLNQENAQLTEYAKKKIRKEAWKPLADEFIKKWSGSIAVIERLYRKTNELIDTDPKYTLLIVCKNRTDVHILEELGKQLPNQLSGMMGNVKVCNTEKLEQFLLYLHPSA
ncbi:MAG: hypothetical protein WCK96_00015 [Methylococcales bacterium]